MQAERAGLADFGPGAMPIHRPPLAPQLAAPDPLDFDPHVRGAIGKACLSALVMSSFNINPQGIARSTARPHRRCREPGHEERETLVASNTWRRDCARRP